jgi:formylglycine-generating enzyme required for sulfatase activity
MELPSRVGKYELEEFLGGGMSHVYRARDTVIGRAVAVKILTEAGCQDVEAKARFLAEARMAGNIAHDNIISIYDFGEDEKQRPFMVMEFLKGEDLSHAIKGNRTGDLASRLKISLQIARALEYIHSQKIVHRDIKPENVHITAAGTVKLMDFGIAKTEGLNMTRAGYVLGTPYYMAPEQVTGQNITNQVDVYAFGILLFELLTGLKPISGDTVERIFYSILNEPLNLDPLRQMGASPAVCDLVARCTAKSPADRPQGFTPVCAELERIMSAEAAVAPVPAPAPAKPPAPQQAPVTTEAATGKPWLIPAIIAAVLLLAGGAYFATRSKPAGDGAAKSADSTAAKAALAPTVSTSTGDMILIPAGDFEYGEKKVSVSLPAFYIDKTEVTNAAFKQFCDATGRPLPKDFAADKPDYPVVNVNILDAHQFATWAGKRLPTGKEWEKAARGTDGRAFPWGNDKDSFKANIGTKKVEPVTTHADGASPYGVLQMVGNVWEFTDQLMQPSQQSIETFRTLVKPSPQANEPWYQMRGESFLEPLANNVIWDFGIVPARYANPNIGFRCAKDTHP